ncbi:MAG: replicative DNA helicase, partial [Ktedonobacteraceae bacterium]
MEKLLPQSIEAECGTLGSIIIDPEAILQVAHFLDAQDFYRDAHRKIYDAIVHLHNAGGPADFITLCNELERRDELGEVGGASYITSLINYVPTSGNIEHYAEIVSQASQLRRAIHAAGQTAAEAYQPDANASDVLSKAQQRYSDIALRNQRKDGFTSSAQLMV